MATQITVRVPARVNSTAILRTGQYGAAALIRTQWSAAETGTYADISGTGSEPTKVIVSGTETYTIDDAQGTSSRWYRTRFESADATRVSDWSYLEPTAYS